MFNARNCLRARSPRSVPVPEGRDVLLQPVVFMYAEASVEPKSIPVVSPTWPWTLLATAIMWPLFLVHLALFAIPFLTPSFWDFVLMFVVTRFSGFGVTIGLHRYFAHRSFKTSRWFQFFLATLGCAALQRGPLWWTAHHRLHHRHSDTVDDVHSPVERGFWHGHFGWLFDAVTTPADPSLVRDWVKYPELLWLERFWLIPAFMMAGLCFLIGGWNGLVYGYCLGTVLVLQVTFAVNSIGHLFGRQRFNTGEGSRNSFLMGILAMGDGWHNNHHRAPISARHGFAWYEIDQSYLLIRFLAAVGIVWDVKQPPAAAMAAVQSEGPFSLSRFVSVGRVQS